MCSRTGGFLTGELMTRTGQSNAVYLIKISVV